MSVLWGLTGSLDTRMVADGKCTDVTYDAATANVLGTSPTKAQASFFAVNTAAAGNKRRKVSAAAAHSSGSDAVGALDCE
jgi:hypothetical protein